jgi:hypothetical protein
MMKAINIRLALGQAVQIADMLDRASITTGLQLSYVGNSSTRFHSPGTPVLHRLTADARPRRASRRLPDRRSGCQATSTRLK